MSKEPNRNVYVGHRYVPKIMGEWDKQTDYEGLSIVTHQGTSYTSKKRVPVGIDILNDEFWVVTGNYNAQVEYYRQDVRDIENHVNDEILNTKNYVNDEVFKSKKYVDDSIDTFPLNVKQRGAIGDGVTDDWQVIQDTITEAEETGKSVYIPGGKYFVSQPLRTKHMVTPLYTQGIHIYGDGKSTIITRNNVGVSDYSNLETISNGAVFAVHGGNNIIEKMMIRESKAGIFLGQHPDFEDRSNAGHNVFENIWLEQLGTCILLVHSLGNHYNKFTNLHLMNFQIGIHFSKGLAATSHNNNRNMLRNIRTSRGWVGFLLENGDGNRFNNIYGEGMVNNGNPVGNQPSIVPDVLTDKPVFLLNLAGDENKFDGVFTENCAHDIYATAYRVSYYNLTVDENKVTFPRADMKPAVFDNKGGFTLGLKWGNDYGLGFRPVNIVESSPDIKSTSGSTSVQYFKRFGGITNWFFNARFELEDHVNPEDSIIIKLPGLEESELHQLFMREPSSGLRMSYPVYVGKSGSVELVRSMMSAQRHIDEVGYPHLIIPSPPGGWGTGVVNNINFSVEFFSTFV